MNRDHALFAKSLAGGLPLLSDTLEHLVALGIIPVVFHLTNGEPNGCLTRGDWFGGNRTGCNFSFELIEDRRMAYEMLLT